MGVRPGLSSRRIVVLSHRDSLARPGLAELSGTAAMLELARLFRARELRKTLVLVSTSGATEGFTGARAWAESAAGGPIDAVLVLGDVAGDRAAQAVGRAVVARLRTGAARASAHGRERRARRGRAARRQPRHGPVDPAGVAADGLRAGRDRRRVGCPAVLIGVSGERGPRPGEPVRRGRLRAVRPRRRCAP